MTIRRAEVHSCNPFDSRSFLRSCSSICTHTRGGRDNARQRIACYARHWAVGVVMRQAPTTTTTRAVTNQSDSNGHDAEIPDGESSDDRSERIHAHRVLPKVSRVMELASLHERIRSHEFCRRTMPQSECLFFSHVSQPNHVNETCWSLHCLHTLRASSYLK